MLFLFLEKKNKAYEEKKEWQSTRIKNSFLPSMKGKGKNSIVVLFHSHIITTST